MSNTEETEDTVFVVCDGDAVDEREPSVEIIPQNSMNEDIAEDRKDIQQAIEYVKQVKNAIKYPDQESFQEVLDKIRERPHIDAEFEEKIKMLQQFLDSEEYIDFHQVVNDVLTQLKEAQVTAKGSKTSLSRPIEVLNEVLPIFQTACSSHVEKIESSSKINKILRELDAMQQKLKNCERIDVGDVDTAKKLEKKGETMLEEAVKHGFEEVERIERKIEQEKEVNMLKFFNDTRTETNDRMDFLTKDFENMKSNCDDDIHLTESVLKSELQCSENARLKFEKKDKELEESILAHEKEEDELRLKIEKLAEKRRHLETERELRQAMQQQADAVHKQAEDELQELVVNLEDLLSKVTTADVVLKQTKDVCNMLFNTAVESKNLQNQNLADALLKEKKNLHVALIAKGVNYLNIEEREKESVEMLKDKIKKKNIKLADALKRHWTNEAKELSAKISAFTHDLQQSKKTVEKVSKQLTTVKEQISALQNDLKEAGADYPTLEEKYEEFKRTNEENVCSLTSLYSF